MNILVDAISHGWSDDLESRKLVGTPDRVPTLQNKCSCNELEIHASSQSNAVAEQNPTQEQQIPPKESRRSDELRLTSSL